MFSSTDLLITVLLTGGTVVWVVGCILVYKSITGYALKGASEDQTVPIKFIAAFMAIIWPITYPLAKIAGRRIVDNTKETK